MERLKIRIQDILQDIAQRLQVSPQLEGAPLQVSPQLEGAPLQVSLQLEEAPLQVSPQQEEAPFTNGMYAQESELVHQLISSEVHCNRIVIVGMEGVGKTTLATLLNHNERVTNHFDARAWVTLSEQYDYNDDRTRLDLRQNIERQLSEKKMNPGEEEESAAESRSQRYLIVLDNVWSSTVWNSLKFEEEGIPIPNGSSTAKIIITTRHMDFADEALPAEGNYVHKMGLLSEHESWELLTRILKSHPLSPERENLGMEIVRRCGGLPPAITKMGSVGRSRFKVMQPVEWKSVLESMFASGKELWHHILGKMEKDLPLHLKRCLFYFGLFPAKFEIPARRLITLWVADEEIIPERSNATQLAEELAESYLRRLIDLCLVQVRRNLTGKVKTCRLLEPVREFWESEAKKYDFFQRTDSSSQLSTDDLTLRLADHLDGKDKSHQHIHGSSTNSFSYKNLVYFLSFDNRKEIRAGEEVGKFINRCISKKGFLLLLFLDLENVFQPQLPKSLCKLTRLRYLGLRSTSLKNLPSFMGTLLSLQTLDLKHTSISTLPGSIWKMQQLRHLYLSETNRSSFARRRPWDGTSLTQLQTLTGAFIDENIQVKGGLDTLLNIRKLGLASRLMAVSQQSTMSSKLGAVAVWIAKLKQLESLKLKSSDENGDPWDLHIEQFPSESKLASIYLDGRLSRYSPHDLEKLFPKTLVKVTLAESHLPIDPMRLLGKLEKLQILQLFNKSYEGVEMRCSKEGFPRLKVLKLWKLEKLKEWHVEKAALPSLTDLEIRSCTSLAELPEGLQRVTTLKELKLSGMPDKFMKKIEDEESKAWYKIKPRDHPNENQKEDMVLLPY